MNHSETVTVFKISQHSVGMFAQLNYCLLLAQYCSEKKLNPYFILAGNGNIDPKHGDNWFNYYFTHKQLTQEEQNLALHKYEKGDYYEIKNRLTINRLTRGDKSIEIQNELTTLNGARKLFNHYISIQDHILNTINKIHINKFMNKKVLGVHYRGIDKHKEATLIEYNTVLSMINKYKKKFDALFLASDEPEFIQFIQNNVANLEIITYGSPSGKIHYLDNSNNYDKGLDALVDSILLSKCDFLIKTPSLLSAWSKVFNPRLPTILLGRPDLYPNDEREIHGYGYYPESILHQSSFLKKLRNRIKEVITTDGE